jgi:hypothetical protein
LKEPLPFNWLVSASSNWIASVGKILDGAAVFVMPEQWRETIQEAEM